MACAGALALLIVLAAGHDVTTLEERPAAIEVAVERAVPIVRPPPAATPSDDAGRTAAATEPIRLERPAEPPAAAGRGPAGGGTAPSAEPTTGSTPDPSAPRVAVILTGLGLDPILTMAAADLPRAVGFGWSAYAEQVAAAQERARAVGRENWLELPLASADPARIDRGPLALRPDDDAARRSFLLDTLLPEHRVHVGALAEPDGFAARPDRLAAVTGELRARGLDLVLFGAGVTLVAPDAAGPGIAMATSTLARSLTPKQVDRFLAEAGAVATRPGAAIIVVRAQPLAIERLGRWLEGLADHGLMLVPPSWLVHDSAPGLHAERSGTAPPGG